MHDKDNLIITGFMGTGKTAVGREVAQRLGREFIDMDALIEAREGMKAAEIFRQRGEAYFRCLEAALCRELATRSGLVIATGGGALIPETNRELLSASGVVICLTASPDDILSRLEGTEERPLLNVPNPRGRIAMLFAERSKAYQHIPLHVDTTGLNVAQVADRVMAMAGTLPKTAITVCYPGGEYSVHLGRGLLAQSGALLRQSGLDSKVALVTNHTVAKRYAASVSESLEAAGFAVSPCVVPDGEAYKTLDTVRMLYDDFIVAGLDRHSIVLALGGGVIGDLAGFAAATYLRGVALVQLPTTLLAMVDASVGGKVGVDHPRGKNLIGAFKQPKLVIADVDTLSTLPAAEFASGLAEVVKAGIIGDPLLFTQIKEHGPSPLLWLIKRALQVKVAIVQEDPYEHTRRAVLNLGHTFGHALELLNNYTLPHGEAVSIGLVADVRLSVRLGQCEPALAVRVEETLARLGLPTTYRGHTPQQIREAMATDKKRHGRTIRFVLIRDIGDVFVTDQVPETDVLDVLASLGTA